MLCEVCTEKRMEVQDTEISINDWILRKDCSRQIRRAQFRRFPDFDVVQ